MKKEHIKKTIEFYAHDYRDMSMNEANLIEMLEGFVKTLMCEHECTSNCRKKGCNCDCGNFHF